jgi:hypothetical protein
VLASGNKDGEVLLWKIDARRPENGRRELPSDVQRVIPLPVRRMVLGKRSNARWSLIDLLTLSEEALPALEIPSGGDVPLIAPIRKRHAPKSLDRTRLKLHGNLKGRWYLRMESYWLWRVKVARLVSMMRALLI